MNALLLHPQIGVSGNLLWPIAPSDEETRMIAVSLGKIRALGYWASVFPEGDGIAFSKESYQPDSGLADFRECFDFMTINEKLDSNWHTTLGVLADGNKITATCLVPVTNFRLLESFSIGRTTFHAPVDGIDIQLTNHRWGMDLCDVPGAEVVPNWVPDTRQFGGLAFLLGYPLIEREIPIPAKLLYEAQGSVSGQENLLHFVTQDADRALDLLRWAFCSYKKLEYLPNKAGWINDFSFAYIIPSFGPKANLYGAKPQVLRVENNWLGLEVEFNPDDEDISVLANILDGSVNSQMSKEVKSALRSIGQAYYLIEPEASFLSLVYAIDALCEVGDLRGPHQRVWVCAAAGNGNAKKFFELLKDYDSLYEIRNRIVHDGETFASLGKDARSANQKIETILGLVIIAIIRPGISLRSEFVSLVLRDLQRSEYISAINTWNPKDIKCPLSTIADDKTFAWVASRNSTYRKN